MASSNLSKFVWPSLSSSPAHLTSAQLSAWERDGVLMIENAVPPSLAAAAAATIRRYVGADPAEPSTWYANTQDIYSEWTAAGKRPHHGPCGMAWLCHHHDLWQLRQWPPLHKIFADLYGTPRLYVTTDRVHFKPPEHPDHLAWSDPGDVHHGLHWDIDTRRGSWPVPYAIQGVLYLEDTSAEQGALRVVRGFHRRFAEWDASQPSNRSTLRPDADAEAALVAEAEPIEGPAGSLVVWHSLLPHGPAANVGSAPRVSAYVTMLPVDAAPFLGPGRATDMPLNMNDAGTLSYLEDLEEAAPLNDADGVGSEDGGDAVAAADAGAKVAAGAGADARPAACTDTAAVGAEGKAGYGRGVHRLSRERRIDRWRLRLPLLDEDPTEDQLSHRPPGEEHGEPFGGLTALGKRLVGLVEWETDGVIRENDGSAQ